MITIEESNKVIWKRGVLEPFFGKNLIIVVPHKYKENKMFAYYGKMIQANDDALLLKSHDGQRFSRIPLDIIQRIEIDQNPERGGAVDQ